MLSGHMLCEVYRVCATDVGLSEHKLSKRVVLIARKFKISDLSLVEDAK